jgi:predicted nuclease of predicted toxin-antitoxin system
VKFIVDAQLPIALADWLRANGHAADHVSTLLAVHARDQDIWDLARAESRVIITKDRDFAIWAADRRLGPQIVWLRLGNATRRVLIEWLEPRWARIEQGLLDGLHLIEVRP